MTTQILSGSFARGLKTLQIDDRGVRFREGLVALMDQIGLNEDEAQRQFDLLKTLRQECRDRQYRARRLPR